VRSWSPVNSSSSRLTSDLARAIFKQAFDLICVRLRDRRQPGHASSTHRRHRIHRISHPGRTAGARTRGDRARSRRGPGCGGRGPRGHSGRRRPLRPPGGRQANQRRARSDPHGQPGRCDECRPGHCGGGCRARRIRRYRKAVPACQRRVDLRGQHLDQRGLSARSTRAGRVEGTDRGAGARRRGCARSS
jgi:hypothetical protein